ncbi:hypothetical protein ACLOJK_029681 [Asimina triloba]
MVAAEEVDVDQVAENVGMDGKSEGGGKVGEADGAAMLVDGVGKAELESASESAGVNEALHVLPQLDLAFHRPLGI